MSINDLMTPLEEIAKEEGRREECFRLVLRLLHRRLGPLGSSIEGQLNALPLDRLESLAEALLDFVSIGDLTEWMDRL